LHGTVHAIFRPPASYQAATDFMKKARVFGFLLVAGLFASWPASARETHGKGKGVQNERSEPGRGNGNNHDQGRIPDDHRAFSDEEHQRIQSYCERYVGQGGKHRRSLPPGLAKKVARGGKLPPGWANECLPGKIMPVEVYHECHPLPPELTVKLPVPPVGTVTVAVDGRVMRILQATREILDVFQIRVRF
jgi:hypothetical protein